MVVVTGDITQRARGSQIQAAKRFFQGIPTPILATPGNHDLPAWWISPWKRIFTPFAPFGLLGFPKLSPVFQEKEVFIAALPSATPWRQVEGRLSSWGVRQTLQALTRAPSDALVVLFSHHPWWLCPKQRSASGDIWQILAKRGGLLLAGHQHRGRLWQLDAHAPFFGLCASTATSTRLRRVPAGYNWIEVRPEEILIEPCAFQNGHYECALPISVARKKREGKS